MNTHKICLMNGDSILITEKQANDIARAINDGNGWITIGSEMINAKAIAKIGFHHATSAERKMTENNVEMALANEGKFDLIEAKRKLVKSKSIQHSVDKDRDFLAKVKAGDPAALKAWYNMTDAPEQIPMTVEESERGDPEYYLNDNGEKIYS